MSNILTIRPLTPENFAPFGEVLDTDGAELRMINEGTTERFHGLAHTEIDAAGIAIVSLFRGQPRHFPYRVDMMERHPLGSQAFYPLAERPWLLIAAEDNDGRPGDPQAFLAHGRQGVNYRANVWHHPLMALNEVSEFLVVDREGEGTNLEEQSYPDPYFIEAADWT
ncbi:MAG: ureidoglycolate lyase [Hyphomicrobiales bacterium]|nr:ureidoglycolate lyase [Hyphomicrobiales bacterium]MCP4997710.1 ureidoglycolate lyase [Hyphomicrobiales bacterium]